MLKIILYCNARVLRYFSTTFKRRKDQPRGIQNDWVTGSRHARRTIIFSFKYDIDVLCTFYMVRSRLGAKWARAGK